MGTHRLSSKFGHVERDPSRAIVRVSVDALWTERDVEDYVATMKSILAEDRARYGVAKVLTDRRRAPVQSQNVHQHLSNLMSTYLKEDDALAILVSSALVRLQAKRALDHRKGEVFLDEEEALRWLASV